MKKILSVILLSVFFMLIIFPTINKELNLIKVHELDGAFYPLSKPAFSLDNWLTGDFQNKFSPWLEENIGLRPFFVRVFNQFRYSVYREATSYGCMIGRDRVLFHSGYYDAYTGVNSVGRKKAGDQVRKMKYIQDRLAEQGLTFLYVMAPGKVSVYNDYLPGYLDTVACDTSNHKLVAEECTRQGVNHLDFVPYFKSLRNRVEYPLFPKGGVHWSGYGATWAADTIFSLLEQISGKDLRDFSIHPGYETNGRYIWTDNDIEKSFNLLFPMRSWTLYYPEVRFEEDTSKVTGRILLIGDSFTQSLFFFDDYFNSLFTEDSQFWSGFSANLWYDKKGETHFYEYEKDKSHIRGEVMQFDYVMIITTEIHTGNFGFGFVDELYGQLIQGKEPL